MINEPSDSRDWRLCRAGRSKWAGAYTSPVLDAWGNLESVESELGIAPGQPFLLRPDGSFDRGVTAYFASPTFRRLARDTQESYARDLKLLLSFLERHGTDWRDITHDTLLDYEFWRRRDSGNPRRVGGSKFSRELAACGSFYAWHVAQGSLKSSPVLTVKVRDHRGEEKSRTKLQPSNVRSVKVKWLTPRAYRRWRDVGLGGYLGDGLPQENWRGRTDGRNVAMSDLMWGSGLRLREAGTLLISEIPRASSGEQYVRGRVAEAVAKGAAREYWVSRIALQRINGYLKASRDAAVRRAQRSGRYEVVPGRQIVSRISSRGDVHYTDESGASGVTHLDALDADGRKLLYRNTSAGLEPLSLWLTEAGDPMPYLTWDKVFSDASDRCDRLGVPIKCHPHMLRHSFALRMLVTLIHAFDRRLGLSERERLEYRHIFGDPWILVQTLLGHSNLETTKSYYLQPVQGLQIDLFLNGDTEEDSIEPLLRRIALLSPRVQDLGDEATP